MTTTHEAPHEVFGDDLVDLEHAQIAMAFETIRRGGAPQLAVAGVTDSGQVLTAAMGPVLLGTDVEHAAARLGLLLRAYGVKMWTAVWESDHIEALLGDVPMFPADTLVTWLVSEDTTVLSCWDTAGRRQASVAGPGYIPQAPLATLSTWSTGRHAGKPTHLTADTLMRAMQRSGFRIEFTDPVLPLLLAH